MKKLDKTETLMTREEAEAKAKELKAGDPAWDYRAVHDPKGTGYSFIEVYDEDGNFVAKL